MKKIYMIKTDIKKLLQDESGRIGWILLWALGIPIPVLFILFFLRGCT